MIFKCWFWVPEIVEAAKTDDFHGISYGAGDENRTRVMGLEGPGTSHCTTPARCLNYTVEC